MPGLFPGMCVCRPHKTSTVCIAPQGPARSGCLVLYHLKKIYRFLPELAVPVISIKDARVEISFINPAVSAPVGAVPPPGKHTARCWNRRLWKAVCCRARYGI